jgi:hypothetical protein
LAYSTNFNVKWPYDPQHCAISAGRTENGLPIVLINPVFGEHVKNISNWLITDAFRVKFPDIADLIDVDTTTT